MWSSETARSDGGLSVGETRRSAFDHGRGCGGSESQRRPRLQSHSVLGTKAKRRLRLRGRGETAASSLMYSVL